MRTLAMIIGLFAIACLVNLAVNAMQDRIFEHEIPPANAPAGGWELVCLRSNPETTMAFGYRGPLNGPAFGTFSIGNGFGLAPTTQNVCEQRVWHCPPGKECDHRLKPMEHP